MLEIPPNFEGSEIALIYLVSADSPVTNSLPIADDWEEIFLRLAKYYYQFLKVITKMKSTISIEKLNTKWPLYTQY